MYCEGLVILRVVDMALANHSVLYARGYVKQKYIQINKYYRCYPRRNLLKYYLKKQKEANKLATLVI